MPGPIWIAGGLAFVLTVMDCAITELGLTIFHYEWEMNPLVSWIRFAGFSPRTSVMVGVLIPSVVIIGTLGVLGLSHVLAGYAGLRLMLGLKQIGTYRLIREFEAQQLRFVAAAVGSPSSPVAPAELHSEDGSDAQPPHPGAEAGDDNPNRKLL